MRPAHRLPLVLAAAVVLPTAAHAQAACASVVGNLVANCGFEDGPAGDVPPGYTRTVSGTGDVYEFGNPGFAHTGVGSALYTSSSGARVTLAQTLATTPGTRYRLAFFAYVFSGAGQLTVAFGDVPLFDQLLTQASNGAYSEFVVETAGPAVGASTALSLTVTFEQSRDTKRLLLDDLSVTAISPTAVVPEPATWTLVGAGLLGVGGVARRRATRA